MVFFNLDPISNVVEFIEKYCTTVNEFGDYKAFTLFEHDEVAMDVPSTFEEKTEWSDFPYRRVWISEVELAKITYVEGDIFVSLYDTKEEFKQSLEADEAFYSVY